MVFLYSDGTHKAVKYNINSKRHIEIESSESYYIRTGHTMGLRVGNYFWIYGGRVVQEKL